MTTLTTRAPATQAAAPKTAKRTRVWAWGRTERLAFAGLLAVTAVAYLWNLSINGYSNEYYSMAIQAGSQSWSSWFFGSLDTANFITVDKTPASLWVMGLSARVFGFSSFAMLLPQALMMVGSVALLYAAVRRWFTAPAAWIAGAVLATTPVAALMFRFNNPDALLVLLMIGAAYAVTRAIDAEKAMRWLVLAGVLIGFAFLTKMMQAFLVLPAFVAAYGLAGKGMIGTRLRGLLAAFGAMIVAAGWWVSIVELIPASSRPIIGGSTNNSILELTLGYNGIGRLNGNEAGSVGGGGGNGGGQWGTTGLGRLFGAEMGTQISWLLPAALLSIGVLVALAARSPRHDKRRSFALLWGGWLLVTGLTFSFMQGIVHSYYTVALAPAIGALVGVGAVELWKIRGDLLARAVLAGGTLLTASWNFHLVSTTWNPWLRPVTLAAGALGAVLVLVGPELAHQWSRRVALASVALIATAAFLGPVAYSATTISAAHTGAIPSAGPSTSGGMGGGRAGGGMTSLLGGNGTAGVSAELVTLLQAGDFEWAAATMRANSAAPLQLASGEPVMAVGGFNGTDGTFTLAQFQEYVAAGRIHYFVAEGSGGGRGMGTSTTDDITTWVTENFTATTVGSTTLYDLTEGN